MVIYVFILIGPKKSKDINDKMDQFVHVSLLHYLWTNCAVQYDFSLKIITDSLFLINNFNK